MNEISFAQPVWLVVGLLVALGLAFAFRFFDQKNRADLEKFVSGNHLDRLRSSISKPLRWTKRVAFIAAVALLFSALARPQIGFEWREVKRKGIDILFALDASRSMLAEDIAPNRLERAKLGMLDFVEKLDGDRVGLLPFSGSAFLLCPLTLDYDAFRQSLEAVDTEIIPRKGTDLASAIREATSTFEQAGNNHRILVVITDGEDLQGEALAAAESAADDGMIIHTVGIGSTTGELIPVSTRGGGTTFLKDENGELVRSKLDEASLQAIAEASGGLYAPFGKQAEGLQRIYNEKLALVPKEELSQRMQQVPIERYQWPLGAAIFLFLLEFLLGDRRRSGKTKAAGIPAGAKTAAIVGLSVFALSLNAKAADPRETYNDSVGAYENGDFEAARNGFQESIANTADLDLQTKAYYNLGNTEFRSGAAMLPDGDTQAVIAEWEKSLAAFDGALKLSPEDADAKFNRDLVQQKIDELKKQEEREAAATGSTGARSAGAGTRSTTAGSAGAETRSTATRPGRFWRPRGVIKSV